MDFWKGIEASSEYCYDEKISEALYFSKPIKFDVPFT